MTKNYKVEGVDRGYSEAIVSQCLDWIDEHMVITKTIRPYRSTYGLKHRVEEYIKHYVKEEEFVEACRRLGVKRDYEGKVSLGFKVRGGPPRKWDDEIRYPKLMSNEKN